jgi:hypothetical protein
MKAFFIFGRSSLKEMKELCLKFKDDFVAMIEDFGGNVRLMPAMLGNKYLFLISSFPGKRKAEKAATALSKLTGISFKIIPMAWIDEFSELSA